AVTIDSARNLYVVDAGNRRVRKITASGIVLPVPLAGLIAPSFAIADSRGNVYVADKSAIRVLSPSGLQSTLLDQLQSPRGLAFDSAGNLYFTETDAARVLKLAPSGALSSLAD